MTIDVLLTAAQILFFVWLTWVSAVFARKKRRLALLGDGGLASTAKQLGFESDTFESRGKLSGLDVRISITDDSEPGDVRGTHLGEPASLFRTSINLGMPALSLTGWSSCRTWDTLPYTDFTISGVSPRQIGFNGITDVTINVAIATTVSLFDVKGPDVVQFLRFKATGQV